MALPKIEPKKFASVFLLAFVVVEAISWLASMFFPELGILKGGWILLLFIAATIFSMLFNFGQEITDLKLKDFVFLTLVVIALIAAWIILPQVIPQIFSINGYEFRNFFIKGINSISGMSFGTGVV